MHLARLAQLFVRPSALVRTICWRARYAMYVETAGSHAIRQWVTLRPLWHGERRLQVALADDAFLVGPLIIQGSGRLTIGPRSYVNQYTVIGVADSVTIGADCMVASNVGIRDSDHGFDDLTTPMRLQAVIVDPIVIGDDVWIGHGVTILKGVHIGDGAIIAAGAVVNADVPPRTIFGGIPARQISARDYAAMLGSSAASAQ
jgi:acetyltransferase-like isoleucine patch superfamily enzyme